jgi:hypothetical protein
MQDPQETRLPDCAIAFIDQLIKRIRYRNKVRQEVRQELVGHFEDELGQCPDEQARQEKARQLIQEFGDPKIVASLIRRAKKRCRPVWYRLTIRTIQNAGIFILYFVICMLPLLVGRSTIRIDFVDYINRLVRTSPDESLNARPYYQKAVEILSKDRGWPSLLPSVTWPGDMNDARRMAVAEVLAASGDALEALRQACSRPYYWMEYKLELNQPQGPSAFAAAITSYAQEDFTSYRVLATRMALQALWSAYKGDFNGAMEDAIVLTRFGMHLEGKGALVEQLVGMGIERLGNTCIFTILNNTQVPAPILRKTRQTLEQYYKANERIINLDIEKTLYYEYIQRSFTDDGKGNGRVLWRGLVFVPTRSRWGLVARLITFRLPDRKTIVRTIDTLFDALQRLSEIEPYCAEYEAQLRVISQISQSNIMVGVSAPAIKQTMRLSLRHKTVRRAIVAVLAALEYRQEHGAYPPDLDQLVKAGYLETVPTDPYTGRPFVYRRTESNFLLYSAGEDQKDDGGIPGTDNRGRPRMWADHGDWIFWPWIG